jgi:hypothetical protein
VSRIPKMASKETAAFPRFGTTKLIVTIPKTAKISAKIQTNSS